MTPFHLNFIKQWQPSHDLLSEPDLTHSELCNERHSLDESLDAQSHDQAQGGDLLEDWPRRALGTSDASTRAHAHKQVTISHLSKVRKYMVDESTIQPSYSSKDRKMFQAEAAREAFRIRKLMAMCPEGYNTGGKATIYLIQHNLLSVEEMIGIENLISVTSAKNSLKERRLHTALVLKKQGELREQNEVNIDMLGDIARLRSSKNVERARLRAVLAAPSRV
ncbi:hypothetical protein HJC23_010850 [Cyclotella cryptica]|uniref:Uncharacterized protein n=1 Tax=Cyclotella cryptica TaxID=29204 RepID=A0ABD3QQ15_9STRA|eukprot:CCRYP_003591-RA/>CCRYP_003591-RA protein AED:0.30 eAED:0.30 QI:0/-1/0/1/-1/1/1/0/221